MVLEKDNKYIKDSNYPDGNNHKTKQICPKCFNIYNIDFELNFNSNIDIALYIEPIYICPNCMRICFQVDNEIDEVVSKLNKLGLYTEMSCEGHIRTEDKHIILDKPFIHFYIKDINDDNKSKIDLLINDGLWVYIQHPNIPQLSRLEYNFSILSRNNNNVVFKHNELTQDDIDNIVKDKKEALKNLNEWANKL